MNRLSLFMITALILMVASTAPQASLGATLLVPRDYFTIQEAIDAAYDGDTVLISNGTYTGLGNKDLTYEGKAITVRSENGPESCIIDCEGDGRGVSFHTRETAGSVFEGITVRQGIYVCLT